MEKGGGGHVRARRAPPHSASNRRAHATQVHENDIAKLVITCEPEGASLMMGALHPRASLFERPVNLAEAKEAHAKFRELLRINGCRVRTFARWCWARFHAPTHSDSDIRKTRCHLWFGHRGSEPSFQPKLDVLLDRINAGIRARQVLTLRDILRFDVETSVTERMRLESFAIKCLTYKLADDCKVDDLKEEHRYYVTDEYKVCAAHCVPPATVALGQASPARPYRVWPLRRRGLLTG